MERGMADLVPETDEYYFYEFFYGFKMMN